MDLKKHLKKLDHHAYYIVGSKVIFHELVASLESAQDIQVKGNSDLFQKEYDILTIDEARELKTFASTLPARAEAKRFFVIYVNDITTEAQNALLKLLEEPPEYAIFFIVIPSAHLLLGTVKSRMNKLEIEQDIHSQNKSDEKDVDQESNSEIKNLAEDFLKSSISGRLDTAKGIVDDISKEKVDRQYAISFLNELEKLVYAEKGVKEGSEALKNIEWARGYMNDRAASIKMLLETLAVGL